MRKQSKPDYNKQVKVLTKHFKNLDQHYVRLIFQFCDFEAVSAYKVLQVLKDLQSPALIIKKLVDFPNQSDKIMKQLEAQFSKKYEQVKPQILSLLTEQNGSEIQRSNLTMEPRFNFFQFIPKDVCATIISYLDPFSFSKISQTNKKFYNISNSDALHFYFKNLSLRLFKNQQPQLPGECRFSEIKKYVQEHANQYGPNIRNAVLNNLRYYVWKTEPKSFKIQTSYYKSFGNFRNLYLQAPRVHFNGTYVCKHKYVKLGQKGFKFNITPLHVCYYYRYIRFFPDGSLLCFVTSNKVRKQQIAHLLSNQNLTNFDPHNTQELKIGEYMQFKNRLYMKIVKSNTVFSYEMQISSNMNKISDELMVISYNLEMVDQKEIIQKLYEYKPLKDRIVFNYLRNTIIEEENSAESKAISL